MSKLWYLICEEKSSVRYVEVYGPFNHSVAAAYYVEVVEAEFAVCGSSAIYEVRQMTMEEAHDVASDGVLSPLT